MNLAYILLLASISNLLFGFFVWRSEMKNPLHISFGIMSFLIALWVFLNFRFQINPNLPLIRSIFALGHFLLLSTFSWAYLLKNKKIYRGAFILFLLIFIFSLILLFIMFNGNLIVKAVLFPSTNIIVGKYFYIYSFYVGSLLLSFIFYLFYIYKKSDFVFRNQLKFVIAGIVFFISIILLVGLILPALGNTKYSLLDSPSSLIFIFFSSLAIIRYQLFNIRLIVVETLTFLIGFVLLVEAVLSKTWTEGILRGGDAVDFCVFRDVVGKEC